MTVPLAHAARKMRQAVKKRLPEPREDSGLTTLEWLLIVAAVAGLAALAVVLVQNVVSDTSDQISGSSARRTAAQIAAADIKDDAVAARSTTAVNAGDVNDEYEPKCDRLEIIYGDVPVTVTWTDGVQAATTPFAWTTEPNCAVS